MGKQCIFWNSTNVYGSYSEIDLHANSFCRLKFKKNVQEWFIVARSGYEYFSAYHKRFGHKRVNSNCLCGQKQSQLYLLSCTYIRKYNLHLWSNKCLKKIAPDEVFEITKKVAAFTKQAPATGLFYRCYKVEERVEDGVQE